ncbi:MAG: sugar phosphate isomerase/epimerase [Phycisphaerales bacterium]|nr:sugar phosphate isomerase/epimerase [Phycisphaerales bacterium]MCB9854814.1 sugar phosphate isomerase/epimerase [Phycisphaerales bacterium]MCB9863714.1 sugar phosphate isomerase/epimerase [Phycisphaerales bacterium]
MQLGYNTNGFAHHRLADVITILAELGYKCIAITLDHHFLDPFDRATIGHAKTICDRIKSLGMTSVVECGSRFLLDPKRKHWPTMLSPDPDDRKRRLEFLKQAIDIAAILESQAVSLWSGAKEGDMTDNEAMSLLVEGCRAVVDHAASQEVQLAFEPEPGMLIDTMDKFLQLREHINDDYFGLTLDLGHIHCLGDGEPADRIHEFSNVLYNIHIEDMRRGAHAHLPFGEGEMNFPPIFAALKDINYGGPLTVELSRHSHDAVNTARNAMRALRNFLA